MEKQLYQLAALDMDGTLLNSEDEISPYTREALRRVDEAGKVIALCTGRALSQLRHHLEAVPAIRYAINESGGCLYDVRAGRVLRQCAIDRAHGERLFELAKEYDVLYQCFFGGQAYMQPEAADRLGHWGLDMFHRNLTRGALYIPDACRRWRESGLPLEKFNLYFTSVEERERFRASVADMPLFIADGMGIGIEISPPEASKSTGLRVLCEHLGIPMERTMAVGDGDNDVDVMRAAGFAVAMGNAVESARAVADALTDDCDHDGAARAVLRYMLGEE